MGSIRVAVTLECMVTTYLFLYKLFIVFLVLYMFHCPNSDALIHVKILG